MRLMMMMMMMMTMTNMTNTKLIQWLLQLKTETLFKTDFEGVCEPYRHVGEYNAAIHCVEIHFEQNSRNSYSALWSSQQFVLHLLSRNKYTVYKKTEYTLQSHMET